MKRSNKELEAIEELSRDASIILDFIKEHPEFDKWQAMILWEFLHYKERKFGHRAFEESEYLKDFL